MSLHRLTQFSLVSLLVLLAACAPAAPTAAPAPTPAAPAAQATTAAPSQPGSLRIGVLPITDVVPFYIALEQGYFKQQGLNVELVPTASAAERDQMMITQQIDGELNDLVSTVLFNKDKPNIK
ncbi:MAG TPA: ABC transporter substrate-binding protein, partial [Anaerolineae bacterium]